ncbi:MAG: cyclase [Microbacteriaceae bacterium]|nr:cyclase [Microbacteriaceae bacterium]
MAQVVQTIDVDVPVSDAYNQWTQFESFPQFLSFVESINQIDNTHTHWTVDIGGVQREFDATITEQVPDDRVAWKSDGGEVKQAGVVTFHKLSDTSSRVAVQLDWEPEGFVEKAGALVGIDDRSVKHDLENFKKFIESKGAADGWRGKVKN